jgi:hypothetical protein
MKEIKLTQGKVALVDDADFEWLNQWKWFAFFNGYGQYYAARNEKTFLGRRLIFMHRVIMNTPRGMDVDHINMDGLNDTHANLRNCTHSQNIQNGKKRSNNSSGYKGVSWHKHHKKWYAKININGKHTPLGYFSNPEDAAHAYDEAAKKYHGEFARTNF